MEGRCGIKWSEQVSLKSDIWAETSGESKGVKQADLGRLPGRSGSWCKGPNAAAWLEYSRDSQEVGVSRVN